jgi:hypothetical protein
MDLSNLFQQITAAFSTLVPSSLGDIFNQLLQFFTSLFAGFGL